MARGADEKPRHSRPADKVDPSSTLRPSDATVEDYRALQKRIGTSRNVIVQLSTCGRERSALNALVAFGPSARAVVVVDTTVTDPELRRMRTCRFAKGLGEIHSRVW